MFKRIQKCLMFLGMSLCTVFLSCPHVVAAESGLGVPNFDLFYASKPEINVYPSFLQASGALVLKQGDQPAYEMFLRTGYLADSAGGAKPDTAITKLQLVSDRPGSEYFAIFQLIDGQPFSIMKETQTGRYWLHGVVQGMYKASVCSAYDTRTGLVSDCRPAQPLVEQKSIEGAASLAKTMAAKYIATAVEMKGFSSTNSKPDETASYIAQQRQNLAQLAP